VETAIDQQILLLGNSSEPKDLDPHIVTGVTEHNIISALMEGLVTEDPVTLEPRPGAAERWAVSDDGKTYTFYLQPHALWSNGDPVTAADFIYSFRRILSPELGAPYAYMLFCVRNAQDFHDGKCPFEKVGFSAPDAATLVISLTAPLPYFLSMLSHNAWFPVHPPTIEAYGGISALHSKWTLPGRYVGNGPFNLEEWQANKQITVTKSSTYWDRESVSLSAIRFLAIGDHKIEERAFRAGQLHVTGTVPMDRIPYYREHDAQKLLIAPYLGCYYYLFNVNRPPLDDPRVRKALALAIDRDQIVTHVTKGGEVSARNFTPPGTGGYTAKACLAGGIPEAKALLAEAGYPNGDGLRPMQLLYNTSDAHGRLAQVIQQMWKQNLNVDIELVNMEWKVYLEQTQQGDFDIARAGWIGDYADPNTFLDMWVTKGGNNRTGWSNADYDRHIQAASSGLPQSERFDHFQSAEQILMDEAPIMPLYFYVSKSLIHPAVKGWYPNILDHHPYKAISLKRDTE